MPDDQDIEVQDEEFAGEPPKSSKAWLAKIDQAEKTFQTYQDKCDNIDKLYADLNTLASPARDREFAMFWANIEVLKPSIYARPPIPVVTPKFKDRRPIPRTASEMLERSCIVTFDQTDIDSVMRLVRDDLVLSGRGAPWCRHETEDGGKVVVEHKDRKDFLHEPARDWSEVGWVAAASYLDKKDMRKRFFKHSGIAYQDANFSVQKDARDKGAADNSSKAKVWEIWSETDNKVYWVTEGVDVFLDEDDPHLLLEGFFPCPKPVYGTVQKRSLIPVPNMLFYKDQLEEINELTARMGALAQAVQVRGFYPAGAGEIGDAIETALANQDNRKILVPISNWAAFGGGSAKDTIIWLPIDMIVTTIAALVEMRKQLIDDVYQITGLSDIMRGATDPNETLGAQQLKSQFGSVRIRDQQAELIRVARDLTRITAEIMAENFSSKKLLEMSQMQLPARADIQKQINDIVANAENMVKQAVADPRVQQAIEQDPQIKEQALAKLEQATQAQIDDLQKQPTIDDVIDLLRSERMRPFVLDIETDSTIQPDEDQEKQRRSEFLAAFATAMQQLSAMVAAEPKSAGFAGEILKFAIAPFRAGRELDGKIDEFVDQMQQAVQQEKPNPEAEAAQADAQAKQQATQTQLAMKKADTEANLAKMAKDAEIKEQVAQEQVRRAEAQAIAQNERDIILLNKKLELLTAEAADKAGQAQIQREQGQEKHVQEMEKGGVQLAGAKAKAAQDGSISVNGEDTTTTDAFAQTLERITERLAILDAKVSQPKFVEVIRDDTGRVAGATVTETLQ